MKALFIIVTLLITVSCGSFAKAADTPSIIRGSQPGSDIILYVNQTGKLEAWEVNVSWINGVYLNYSRAPWGDPTIDGKPTQVCSVSGKNKNVVGISEDKDRLLTALTVVLQDQVGYVPKQRWFCDSYEAIVARDPSHADLRKYAEWVSGI